MDLLSKLLKRAQKDAKLFELSGFNSAWRRLDQKPKLQLRFWTWLKHSYAALPMIHTADARVDHILHQLIVTPKNGTMRVDLHGLNKEAAVATVWHFVVTADCSTTILFVTGRGKHSHHYNSVLLHHLQAIFKKADCKYNIPAGHFSLRVTCTRDTQVKLNTYCLNATSQPYQHTKDRVMKPSKQHHPGHIKYDRQQRILQDRKKKQERSLHAALREKSKLCL